MEIVLNEAQITIGDIPGQPGFKFLQFITQQGIKVTVPLNEQAARAIAAGLTSGLLIASGPLASQLKPQ
jgi:chloramphenicol O-acetyltransferase